MTDKIKLIVKNTKVVVNNDSVDFIRNYNANDCNVNIASYDNQLNKLILNNVNAEQCVLLFSNEIKNLSQPIDISQDLNNLEYVFVPLSSIKPVMIGETEVPKENNLIINYGEEMYDLWLI